METAHRTLPQSIEAEMSVLGSVLISEKAAELAQEYLKPDDFCLPQHQDIYKVMLSLLNAGRAVDSVTVVDALDRAGILASVGGMAYVDELAIYMPTAANVLHYIKIVEERSIMRRLISAGTDIASDAMAGEKPVSDMLDEAERRVFNISMRKSQDTVEQLGDSVMKSYYKIGELMKNKGAITGVPTGFSELDKLTGGLQRSDLIIVAGRPSMGKTAFALNIAQSASVRFDKKVLILSLEMSKEQLALRLLCSESLVDMQRVKQGDLDADELLRISGTLEPLTNSQIYLDDTGGMTVADIRSRCRRQLQRYGLDLVIIDYLGLMQTSAKAENRVTAIAEITRALKMLARELNVPIVLLSQLSRGPEQRSDHRPVMADLRESGAIEQDADIIILLYRKAAYDPSLDNTTEVIVAKHRNGPTKTVKLAWVAQYARFTEMTDREEDD